MATSTIELFGYFNWAKVFEHNRDQGPYDKETDGAISIDLLMDEENLKKYKASGIGRTVKTDPEGRGFTVKFKRPWKDKYGRDWAGGPIGVYQDDGQPWNPEVNIGNMSYGALYVDVYTTNKGNGSRLKAIQILELVPYVTDGGGSQGASSWSPPDRTAGKAETPSPVPPTPAPTTDIGDDEIPF